MNNTPTPSTDLEAKLRIALRGHPDCELWGDAGLIAATMRWVDALDKAIEQRDLWRTANVIISDYARKLERELTAMTEQRDEARIELEKYTTDSEDDALYNVRRLRKELTAATEQLDELARQNKLFRNETLIWVDCDAVRKDEYNTVIQQLDEAREALRDMLSGWRYIRKTHGDLYGVGWDRAQNKAEQALQSLTPNEP